jgi:hypothetical protein
MTQTESAETRDAAQAANLLVTVATTLNERLAVTAGELARSQEVLREASDQLMLAFRGAADRIVAAQKAGDVLSPQAAADRKDGEYGPVLDHLYSAVQHLQSHDLVNQLIDAQKMRVEKMREKLEEALALATPSAPEGTEQWIGRSRAMLDCIIAGIRQMDEEPRGPSSDRERAGSVDLF